MLSPIRILSNRGYFLILVFPCSFSILGPSGLNMGAEIFVGNVFTGVGSVDKLEGMTFGTVE